MDRAARTAKVPLSMPTQNAVPPRRSHLELNIDTAKRVLPAWASQGVESAA